MSEGAAAFSGLVEKQVGQPGNYAAIRAYSCTSLSLIYFLQSLLLHLP